MKKMLLNGIGVLILSACVLSCSKKEEDKDSPITKQEIGGQWTISEDPVIDVVINAGADGATYQRQVNEKLEYLFHKGDKYLFGADSCKVTRGNSIAPYPETYRIEDKHIVLDGYIRFLTDWAGGKLTLRAGNAEIREIIKVELAKPEYGYDSETITAILNFVQGEVRLVFVKN
jgi:hypothetical protein